MQAFFTQYKIRDLFNAYMQTRGVTRGAREEEFYRRRNTELAPKSRNNITSTFLNTVHLLLKDLRVDHGGAVPNFFLASGAIYPPCAPDADW